MNCSCVILNYCEAARTIALASGLVGYSNIARVVVVDNNSPDDSWEQLHVLANNDAIILIQSDNNGGYGAGNNIGIEYCLQNPLNEEKQLVMIINPDAMIGQEAITECIECFEHHDNIFVAAPVEYDLQGKRFFGTAWETPRPLEYTLQFLAVIGRLVKTRFYAPGELTNRFSRVDCVSGALFFVDAEKFRQIGMFHNSIFLYFEETSIGVRAKGVYESYLCNNARYTHEFSTSVHAALPDCRKRFSILNRSRLSVLLQDYKIRGIASIGVYLCFAIAQIETWPKSWLYTIYSNFKSGQ